MERNDRCSVIHSALVTLAQRGKRRPKQTLQRIVLPPLQPQLQVVSEVFADNISSMHTTQPQLQRVSQVKLVICMQRCGPSGMFLLSACFGMFDFGMFKYFLLSPAAFHTHTMQRCGPSGMFLLSACFGMFDFGMFILACLSTFFFRPAAFHTHTCGQVLVLLVVDRQGSTALQQRCAAQT